MYNGLHFKPLRKFTTKEIKESLYGFSKKIENDFEHTKATMSNDGNYNYNTFYDAANNTEADVFLCLENGKHYVPGGKCLFIYKA